MVINSYEFRVIWYYLTSGKTLKHPDAIRIMKSLGAKKKKDRYYVDRWWLQTLLGYEKAT
jgi:hypothetical protein